MPIHLITGTDDDDVLNGTQARDLIRSFAGDDWIVLNGGRDTVHGQEGDDSVFGYFGGDHIHGGAGNDQLVSSGFPGGAAGYLYGGRGDDMIFAGDDADFSYGGAGDDQVTVHVDLGGVADGGTGVDRLVLNGIGSRDGMLTVVTDVVVVLNGPGATASAGSQSMALSGFEVLRITTSEGDDFVRGGDLHDEIDLSGGANEGQGMGGDDLITYRTGAANVLDGGDGRDTLRVVHYGQTSGLQFSVAGGDGFGSTLVGFERWQVVGGVGDDVVSLGADRDIFQGFAGRDVVFGMAGVDRLDGGTGRDVLEGGVGRDVLTGGAGGDAFVFRLLDDLGDRITDFETGVDVIRIEGAMLSGALGRGPVAEGQFHLGAPVGVEGQFLYQDGLLIWDADGSDVGQGVLILRLDGAPTLNAADLLIL